MPEFQLQSLKGFSRSDSSGITIDLLDVDAGTGHVIAHFLHTGTYQTLADRNRFTSSASAATEFKKALSAFVAAKKYGLTALQELAKAEAVQWGEEVSIVEATEAVSEDTLMESQDDAEWFQTLMLQKAEQAFDKDGGMSFTATFFNNIKNPKLAKLIAQRATEHYLERLSMLRKVVAAFENEATVPVNSVVEDIGDLTLAAPLNDLVQPPSLERDDLADPRELEILEEVAEAPEPGPPSTAGEVAEPEPALAPEPKSEPVAVEEPLSNAPAPVTEVVETAVDHAPAAEPAAEEDPWDSFGTTKTKKSKKKKKGSAALAEESNAELPADFVPEPLEAEDDGWGSLTIGVSTKKEKKKGAVKEEMPPPEPEPRTEPAVEPVPEPIAEPTMEPVPEAPAVNPFAGLSKSQKKKLEKKRKEEALAREKQAAEREALEAEEAQLKRLQEVDEKDKRTAFAEDVPASEPEPPELLPEEATEPFTEPEPLPETGMEVIAEMAHEALQKAVPEAVLPSTFTVEESPLVVEPPPPNEERNIWSWGATWGAAGSSGKKKKKKKGKKAEAVEVEAPPSPPPPPPPDLEFAEGEDLIEPEPDPKSEAALPVEKKYHPDSGVDVDAPGDVHCPWRYEHLTQGDAWMDCKRCELYMWKIAVKLHSAGLPDVNGLVTK